MSRLAVVVLAMAVLGGCAAPAPSRAPAVPAGPGMPLPPGAARDYGPMALASAPFMFRDYAHWAKFRDSPFYKDVKGAYTAKTGVKIVVSYGPSSGLAKQIEQGAPADIFISADLDWMDYVAKAKLINDETRVNLFGNRLVLIAPQSSTASLKIEPGFKLAEALGDGRLAMADVKSVPAGKYGSAALKKLGVWVVGLDAGGEKSLHRVELGDEPVCLVLGAEGEGLSRLVRQRCDQIVSIPLVGSLSSLNVATAAALAIYEVVRRRSESVG